jgi:hypothetical protein
MAEGGLIAPRFGLRGGQFHFQVRIGRDSAGHAGRSLQNLQWETRDRAVPASGAKRSLLSSLSEMS